MDRVSKVIAVAAMALTTLTACDPPIPESLLVAQAEREVQCGEPGEVLLYLDSGYVDLAYTWQEMLAASCPELSLTPIDDLASADIIGSALEPECSAVTSAPLGFDGSAVAFYLDEAFALNLDGETIQGLFSGQISNWSDPALAELNPDIDFPDLEVVVMESSSQPAIAAMEAWTSRLTGKTQTFDLLLGDTEAYFMDLVFELEAGGIALVPMSDALASGATIANVITSEAEVAVADGQGMYAGSTMFALEQASDGSGVVAIFDPSSEPKPFPGTGEAAVPYEAIYPVKLYLCGDDSLSLRAAARYLVRLDAQGVIATSTLQALSEDVRVASALILGEGLPLPELSDLDNLNG